MLVKKVITQGEELQVPSVSFNFLFVVNNSSHPFAVELTHNDVMNPVVIIKDVSIESEEDKAIKDKLKEYEGVEI